MANPTLEQFAASYDQPQGRGWNSNEWNNIQYAYNQAYPSQSMTALGKEFLNYANSFTQPQGRGWWSNEISNIQNSFMANHPGMTREQAQQAMNESGLGSAAYVQAPADQFPEGQRHSSGIDPLTGALLLGGSFLLGPELLAGFGGEAAAGAGAGWLSAEGGAGYLGGLAADASALGGAAAGVGAASPGWTSGFDLAGGGDVAAGGVGGGSGGGIVASGTKGESGGSMDWLDELLNSPGGDASQWANTGTAASDAEIEFANQLNNAAGLPSGPSPLDVPGGVNSTIPQAASGSGLMSKLLNAPTSLLKQAFGLNDSEATSLARMLGTLGSAGLGAYASSQNSNALQALYDRAWGAGQPSRDRFNAAMTPGFDMNSIPGYKSAMDTSAETYLRKLSAQGGNPAGIGAAPSQTQAYLMGTVGLPAWQNYAGLNSSAGGLGAISGQATGAGAAAATSNGNFYNAIGSGLSDLLNPKPTQEEGFLQMARALKAAGLA